MSKGSWRKEHTDIVLFLTTRILLLWKPGQKTLPYLSLLLLEVFYLAFYQFSVRFTAAGLQSQIVLHTYTHLSRLDEKKREIRGVRS